MDHDLSADNFRQFLSNKSSEDLVRIRYCYEIGSTFVALNIMEDAIVGAMVICDRIKLSKALGDDLGLWNEFNRKHSTLHSSTLGNLISILSKHEINQKDIAYLRWMKEKRDFFIHRFFRRGEWPGELQEHDCQAMIRRLRYLQIIFLRMSRNIFKIFARADLMAFQDLGSDGFVLWNHDLFESEDGQEK